MESVKNKDYTKSYIIERFIQVLQVWIYYHLRDFAAGYGELIKGNHHLWFLSKVAKVVKAAKMSKSILKIEIILLHYMKTVISFIFTFKVVWY